MYEGGNTTEKVVAKGEKKVVKDEVLPTSNLKTVRSALLPPSEFHHPPSHSLLRMCLF